MTQFRVLIVEDEVLIALDLEQVLTAAGCKVVGTAASQGQALAMGEQFRPDYAVVDVRLSPGDGRVVSKLLTERYGTAVLIASAHCRSLDDLTGTGALACIPKPYSPDDVLPVLKVLDDIRAGHTPEHLPRHMLALH